jgi:hypothetical protein
MVEQNEPDEEYSSSSSSGTYAALLGSVTNFRHRVSRGEAILNVDAYATALGKVLASADDEHTLALLGPWGRGKTFLAAAVADEVEYYHGYKSVNFSAWAYPERPALWAHLYACIRKSALDDTVGLRIARTLRFNIARVGLHALISAALFAAVLLLPVTLYYRIAWQLYTFAGIGVVFLLVRYYLRLRSGIPVIREWLTVRDHDATLGLQATIGRDLRSLLEAWIPRKVDIEQTWDGKRFWYFLAWATLAAAPWASVSTWSWIAFALTVLTLAVAVTMYVLATRVGVAKDSHPRRVLLCVDDLDRCVPSTMLELIESLRQFLEATGVAKRLQVMFLVEERALQGAILSKYRSLADRTFGETASRNTEVVNANIEKLFVTFLRLPPLTREELNLAITTYAESIKVRTDPAPLDRRQRGDAVADPTVFTEDELYAFTQVADACFESQAARPTIRSAHNLVRRYQLGRAVLQEFDHRIEDPRAFISRIAGDTEPLADIEEAVAEQVAMCALPERRLRRRSQPADDDSEDNPPN